MKKIAALLTASLLLVGVGTCVIVLMLATGSQNHA